MSKFRIRIFSALIAGMLVVSASAIQPLTNINSSSVASESSTPESSSTVESSSVPESSSAVESSSIPESSSAVESSSSIPESSSAVESSSSIPESSSAVESSSSIPESSSAVESSSSVPESSSAVESSSSVPESSSAVESSSSVPESSSMPTSSTPIQKPKEVVETIDISDQLIQAGGVPSYVSIPKLTNPRVRAASTVEDVLLSGLSNQETKIDISSFKIAKENVGDLIFNLLNHHGELFYVDQRFSYTLISSGSETYIGEFIPNYLFEDIETAKSKFNAELSKAYAYIDQNSIPGNDASIVLAANDYIVSNVAYDLGLDNYTAYDIFVNKTAVCQGYTLAMGVLMNNYGIKNTVAPSDGMNHIWNLLEIDGEWYHCDVTWNDPAPDIEGNAFHDYVLVSDETMLKRGSPPHYGWVSPDGITATSTLYDNAFWVKLKTSLPLIDGYYYYGDEHNDKSGVFKVKDIFATPELVIQSSHNDDSIVFYDGLIYYNDTNTKIYSIKSDGTEKTLFKELSFQSGEGFQHKAAVGNKLKVTTYKNGWKNYFYDFPQKEITGGFGSYIVVGDNIFIPYLENIAKIKTNLDGWDSVVVKSGSNVVQPDTVLASTSQVLEVTNGSNSKILTIVVLGDCDGTPGITSSDLASAKNHILTKIPLIGIYLIALDVTEDMIVDSLDLHSIRKSIVA